MTQSAPGSTVPSRPRVLCGDCGLRPVEANSLCHQCRNYVQRNGHGRSLAQFERQEAWDRISVRLALGKKVPDSLIEFAIGKPLHYRNPESVQRLANEINGVASVALISSPAEKLAVSESFDAKRRRDAGGKEPWQPIDANRFKPAQLVYFFQRGDKAVKIGVSTQLRARKVELETGAGPLILLGIELGGFKREKQLHFFFASLRLHGEWFRAGTDLVGYIKALRPESERLMAL